MEICEMKITFKKEPNETNPYDSTSVTVETYTVSLDNILEEFTAFLKACGFSPKGELAFVEEDDFLCETCYPGGFPQENKEEEIESER